MIEIAPSSKTKEQTHTSDGTGEQVDESTNKATKTMADLDKDSDGASTVDSRDGSTEESSYNSAHESLLGKERRASSPNPKAGDPDELSTGDEFNFSDETNDEGPHERSNLNAQNSESSPENAPAASQKQGKTARSKSQVEKFGVKDVFDARTPKNKGSKKSQEDTTQGSSKLKRGAKLGSVTCIAPLSQDGEMPCNTQIQSGDNTRPRPLIDLEVNPSNDSAEVVPIQVDPKAPSIQREDIDLFTRGHEDCQKNSAAVTEAQAQAEILKEHHLQAFWSSAFNSSSAEEKECKGTKDSDPRAKLSKKKRRNAAGESDPVMAELARQQIRYKEYLAKRIKENPEHYLKRRTVIHQLTFDDEFPNDQARSNSDKDMLSTGPPNTSNPHGQKSHRVEDNKDDPRIPRAQRISKRKRKENDDGEERGEPVHKPEKLQKTIDQASLGQPSSIQSSRYVSISVQRRNNDATSARTVSNDYRGNAEFMATLKSLWSIIPKALLRATMSELNKAHRVALQSKLEHCLKGKQMNPNIRVVTRRNEQGDEVDLVEEDGSIVEPDPHTMSSDLTLLTAARDLIVLLSGKRVGLDLAAVVARSLDAKSSSSAYRDGSQSWQQVSELSALEEPLRRIANERQIEIEKLREENRRLTTMVKKRRD